jgi:hypothetical protein
MFNLGVVCDRIVGVPGLYNLYFLLTSSRGTVGIIVMYGNLRHSCLHFNNRAAKRISNCSLDLEGRKEGWMEGMKEGRRVGGREGREEGRKGGRKEGRKDTTLTHTLISQLTVQVDG